MQGSWYGSWAVCFTYGMWFGVSGLAALGHDYFGDEAVRRAVMFLLDKQRLNGGWGESYLSCQDKVRPGRWARGGVHWCTVRSYYILCC